jgi:intracellular multiplication protein IcmO
MRGLSREREIDANETYRDIRTPGQRIAAFFEDSPLPSIVGSCLLLSTALLSTSFFFFVGIPAIYWMTGYAFRKEQALPMLLPKEAKVDDPSDPKPSRVGNHKARGEFLFGNQRFSAKPYELWGAFAHLLTHQMLLGSSGSGKTETLVSKVANYLSVGSGVCYSDAKAAPKLGWQIYSLCRYFGREDDFRSLNYIKGNTSAKPDAAVRRGNNVNLFTHGSAESITQIIVSLMPPGGGENKLFSERAIGLISAVMPGLVDLRDNAGLKINPGVLRKALEFEEVQKLKRAKPISPESREAVRAYLTSLPGYSENPVDRNGKPTDQQQAEVYRMFGFATAYFTRALSSLTDTYGDIYMVGRGECNFLDAVKRRRVYAILIPSLEKAPDELKNLAKIVLAAQKNAISTGLPPDIEGRKEDVLDNLPTSASTPYGIINDEFAFMMTPGYGAVLAQARGLYVAITIAAQDFAGMKREDADEAEQIAENTKIKILMASEGLGATREMIQEIAGEGMAAAASSFAMDEGSLSLNYRDGKSASFEKRARVDVRDTRAAVEGEGIIFWRDRIIPVSMFYHGMTEKEIISDYPVTRLLDVGYPERGYGKTLLAPDNPVTSSLKKAVHNGLSVDVDESSIPSMPQMSSMPALPLDRALPQFRSLVRANPDLSIMDRDGLLMQLLMNYQDEDLTKSLMGSDRRSGSARSPDQKPATGPSRSEIAAVAASTLTTLAPPEDRVDSGFDDIDSDEIEKAMISIDDEQASISMLEDEHLEDIKGVPHTNDEPVAGSDKDRVMASEGQLATSSLVASAPWLIDTRQLADRANRTIHPTEAAIAAASAEGAAKLEQALGTDPQRAKQVGMETAHAVIRGFEYPSRESPTPAAPQNAQEEELVIKDQARTVNRMKAWVDGNS